MFFKPYQLDALKALWAKGDGMTTREVWYALGRNEAFSRASIINFLESAYENGFLDKTEITGKGGHRGAFTAKYDEAGTKAYLKRVFMERLKEL